MKSRIALLVPVSILVFAAAASAQLRVGHGGAQSLRRASSSAERSPTSTTSTNSTATPTSTSTTTPRTAAASGTTSRASSSSRPSTRRPTRTSSCGWTMRPTRRSAICKVEYFMSYATFNFGHSRFVPFFTIGAGAANLVPNVAGTLSDSEIRFTTAAGGGVKFFVCPWFAFRFDGKLYATYLGDHSHVLLRQHRVLQHPHLAAERHDDRRVPLRASEPPLSARRPSDPRDADPPRLAGFRADRDLDGRRKQRADRLARPLDADRRSLDRSPAGRAPRAPAGDPPTGRGRGGGARSRRRARRTRGAARTSATRPPSRARRGRAPARARSVVLPAPEVPDEVDDVRWRQRRRQPLPHRLGLRGGRRVDASSLDISRRPRAARRARRTRGIASASSCASSPRRRAAARAACAAAPWR